MTSPVEASTVRALRRLLADAPQGGQCHDSPERREFLAGLEFLIPELMPAEPGGWPRGLAIDGILAEECTAVDRGRVVVRGMAILLGGPHDQRISPVFANMRIAPSVDAFKGFHVLFGERDGHGELRSYPLGTVIASEDVSSIEWMVRAARRPFKKR